MALAPTMGNRVSRDPTPFLPSKWRAISEIQSLHNLCIFDLVSHAFQEGNWRIQIYHPIYNKTQNLWKVKANQKTSVSAMDIDSGTNTNSRQMLLSSEV